MHVAFHTTDFSNCSKLKPNRKRDSFSNSVILGSLLKISCFNSVKISAWWKERKCQNFIILLLASREASARQQLLQGFTSHMSRDLNQEKQLPNSGGSKRLRFRGLPEAKHFFKLKTQI